MTAYAAATSTSATLETVNTYREVLRRIWILDPVSAWVPSRNYFSRLTQPAKHHLADPALAAVLLGVGADALLEGEGGTAPVPRDGTLLGHLFESR